MDCANARAKEDAPQPPLATVYEKTTRYSRTKTTEVTKYSVDEPALVGGGGGEEAAKMAPLRLTLENFESAEAARSPYVLTSPRSLDACRILGIKPVELLYQSLAEVRQQLGGESASLDRVVTVYQQQERERRSKLEACRAVRDHLLLGAATAADFKENSDPQPHAKPKPERHASPAARHENPLRSLENKSEEPVLTVAPTPEEPPAAPPKPKPSCSPPKTPSVTLKVNTSPRRRNNNKVRPRTVPNVRVSPASPSFKKRTRPKSSASCASSASPSGSSFKLSPSRRVASSASGFSGSTWRSWSASPLRSGRPCGQWASAAASSAAPRRTLFGQIKAQLGPATATIPEHDRRILDSMVLKREQHLAAQHLAFEAHKAWEESKQQHEKEKEAHTQRWREQLLAKRRAENELNERKREALEREAQLAGQQLQLSLEEKQRRAAALLEAAAASKGSAQGEKAEAQQQHRAEVIAARRQLDQQHEIWRHSVRRRQQEKQRRADHARTTSADASRRRVASANRADEMRRAERREALQAEEQKAAAALRASCEQKQRRAELRLSTIALDKHNNLLDQSESRKGRLEEARRLHTELEAGLAQWRQRCAQLQQDAAAAAATRASQRYLDKKRHVEQANRTKQQHHTLVMSRICANRRASMEAKRTAVSAKEHKMQLLQQRRDAALKASRSTALTTALLRDDVRRTLTPETFDRVVARSALEVRTTLSPSRSPSSATVSLSKSHIALG